MEFIQKHWKDFVDVITYIIAIASIIVRLTPSPKDDNFLAKIISVLSKIALNKETPSKQDQPKV